MPQADRVLAVSWSNAQELGELGGRAVDLRVSTLPTQFGESVVLRVLDQSAMQLELGQLGLPTAISEDGGASWDSVSIDLPVDSAQSLALSLPVAGPPTLHAGTDEGVWSITRVPDGDIDGPPDATEDLAPNAGDGNADGQPDRLQAGVASFEIPAALLPVAARGTGREGTVSNTDLAIEGGGCQQVYDTAAIDPLALPDDPGFAAEAGVVRFEYIGCTTVNVRLTFHDETFGPDWRLRRYGPITAANVLTLGWLNQAATRNGNSWSFTLTDNSAGDLRREPGRILFVGAAVRALPLFANGFE